MIYYGNKEKCDNFMLLIPPQATFSHHCKITVYDT